MYGRMSGETQRNGTVWHHAIPRRVAPIMRIGQVTCPNCQRQFRTDDALLRHMKRYHGEVTK